MGRWKNLLLKPRQDLLDLLLSVLLEVSISRIRDQSLLSTAGFFMACSWRRALIQKALEGCHSPQPWIWADGCTTTPATQALSASKRALTAWMLGESQAEATQRNTKGSAWKPDLAQTCDPPGANSALYCAKPNDNRARAAPHDQTGGNRVQSPESCTDRLGWHAPLHAPVMPEHQNAGQEQVSR